MELETNLRTNDKNTSCNVDEIGFLLEIGKFGFRGRIPEFNSDF